MDFGILGILPRTLTGIVGIFTGPLIHGDTLHLLSNTFPLLLLMMAVFYFYDKIALEVFLCIYLITGFWVWLAARQAYHIGSSGLVYGLASFLFFGGLFRRDIRSIAVAICIAFLYGGMFQGIFPTSGGISWESHLLGSAAGVLCSFYFRNNMQLDEEPDAEQETAVAEPKEQPASNQAFTKISSTYLSGASDSTEHPVYCYELVKEERCGRHTLTYLYEEPEEEKDLLL